MQIQTERALAPIELPFDPTDPPPMSIIEKGATAPDFTLESHTDEKVTLSSFKGKKNVLLAFYPLDFTPT